MTILQYLRSLVCKHEYGEPFLFRAPDRDAIGFECVNCGRPLVVLLKTRWER